MEADPIADERVQIHAGDVLSASLRAADGRWVRIHSGRDPVTEANRFVEGALGAIPGGAPAVVIVIGPGLGYIVDAIERRAPDTKVIAIEPFATLARAMLARRDWRARLENKRLAVISGPEYRNVSEGARLIDARAAASTVVIEHPVLAREFGEEMAAARAVAQRMLEGARLNAEARKAFAGRYLLNTLWNLPALLEEGDVASLRGAFSGIPAVVVAAGPSLDVNLPHLRRLTDRALIVAVDTTLRPLRHAGIRPHLVVAVDPSELNARHLLGLDDTHGSWLVSEGSIDPRVFPQFARHAFSFKVSDHQPWPWLREHGFDRGTLRAWGSVLTTAFDLTIEAGCEPIIFVGADLAFTGGVHYCRGTMNEQPASYERPQEERVRDFAAVARDMNRPTCEEPDVRGAATTSTPQFLQFRDWLVSRAVEAAPRRVLNATGAGILHGDGVTQADLERLALPDAVADIAARLRAGWVRSSRDGAPARERLTPAVVSGAGVPMADWLEFGGDTASEEQVRACLASTWLTAPAVTHHPRSAARMIGRTATLTAAASGGPRPSVRWQSSRDGERWSDVEGATAAPLQLRMSSGEDGSLRRAVFTNVHGTAISSPATLRLARPGLPYDFDGDGHADLVWRHYGTGLVLVWHMEGTRRIGSFTVDEPAGDRAWRLAAVADFNGDGRPDLLWQHASTGSVRLWELDGAVVARSVVIGAEQDRDWQVAGGVDVDGDGRFDILWRHAHTGALRAWLMDDTAPTATLAIPSYRGAEWLLCGIGDFRGVGARELVWRHSHTGAIEIEALGTDNGADVLTLPMEPDLSWQIAGTQAFTGSGRSDLFWRHSGTGSHRIWLLDAPRVTDVVPVDSIEDTSWVAAPEFLVHRSQ